jgi:hypothetical protein
MPTVDFRMYDGVMFHVAVADVLAVKFFSVVRRSYEKPSR